MALLWARTGCWRNRIVAGGPFFAKHFNRLGRSHLLGFFGKCRIHHYQIKVNRDHKAIEQIEEFGACMRHRNTNPLYVNRFAGEVASPHTLREIRKSVGKIRKLRANRRESQARSARAGD